MSRGCKRAASGEHVVDDQDAVLGSEGVVVDLQRATAVFEDVLVLARRVRQFARLADRNESRAEVLRDDAAEDEAAGLDGRDHGDAVVAERLGEHRAHTRKRLGRAQEWGDVFEEDSRLRKVGNVADEVVQLFDGHQNFTSKSGSLPEKSCDSWSIRVTSA